MLLATSFRQTLQESVVRCEKHGGLLQHYSRGVFLGMRRFKAILALVDHSEAYIVVLAEADELLKRPQETAKWIFYEEVPAGPLLLMSKHASYKGELSCFFKSCSEIGPFPTEKSRKLT